jgi:uncharacterized protein (DUF362 family)
MVAETPFATYAEAIPAALEQIGAAAVLAKQATVLIKPNLINTAPHPVTTPAACCEALIGYIRACSSARILIAEGCGDPRCTTAEVFQALGYDELARRLQIELLDLNTAPLQLSQRADCRLFPQMWLPQIALRHFLISVPVLKAHSLADITGSLKNMMGLLPPDRYGGSGSWNKAAFHADLQTAIVELNCHRPPDLSLMDASLGLAAHHLGGPVCRPPVNRILAGFDPWALDRRAAGLLGLDWRAIAHLKAAPPAARREATHDKAEADAPEQICGPEAPARG